jgi:hypothetical protein
MQGQVGQRLKSLDSGALCRKVGLKQRLPFLAEMAFVYIVNVSKRVASAIYF